MLKEITTQNFEDVVLKSKNPVMLKFGAEWCGPCKMMEPILEDIAKDFQGKAEVVTCDIDENHQLAERFGIRNIPTTLYFKNGNIADKQVGAGMKSAFVNKLNPLLS